MNVFDRYSPFIQDYIHRAGWQTLRGVQNAAGDAIFGTEENVLLTASTASGKTEAAFFPILTLLDEEPSRTGFAHLFEHLMFGGTKNVPDYDRVVSGMCGDSNASTNNDYTSYYLTVPARNLEPTACASSISRRRR